MKKLFTLFMLLAMFAVVGCESLGGDGIFDKSYSINGNIQKGPFIQGSSITIQPLNSNLKPIGQMFTTQTANDAGLFELDGVNSKFADIIATGYYFDEVVGKISSSMLTLRSIADLEDGAATNVNILTTLTYNRIKSLVTNDGKDVTEAQNQAEKELYTALGIPADLQPNVSCGAMNIANNGEGDGLLLALSAILQDGRSVGELTEYISKFAYDLADDGQVSETLVEKFNLDGRHVLRFDVRIKNNLRARYEDLGIECNIPEFSQYMPYFGKPSREDFFIPFTYYEKDEVYELFPDDPEMADNLNSIKVGFEFSADVEYLGYEYVDGYGEIYLSGAPTVINTCRSDVLRTIDIPDSVTSIGEEAFTKCLCLGSITIPNSVTSIGRAAFNTCLNLTSITIPNSVTRIGEYAFGECRGLTSVTIPGSVTEIGNGAFLGCTSLTSITIPDSVTSIGSGAFSICQNLTSATIGNGVVSLGDDVFSRCPKLVEFKGKFASEDGRCLIVDGGLKAFAPAGLTEYTTPDGVTHISSYTFCECDDIEHITISEGVTTIGDYALFGCNNLKSVSIPGSVSDINTYAFCFCAQLTNIDITEGVMYIGDYAFSDCDSLTEITLPSTLLRVGHYAFASWSCKQIRTVYCKAIVPPFALPNGNWGGFSSNSVELTTIYVPSESVERYKTADGWNEYADNIVGYDFE